MFTKLNRVLLASGLAVASAALLSPSAFAANILTDSGTVDLSGTVEGYTNLDVVNQTGANGFLVNYLTGTTGQQVAVIKYETNVQGAWTIKAQGLNAAGKEGTLLPPTGEGTAAGLPYTLSLDGGAKVRPVGSAGLASATALAGATVTNAVLLVPAANLTLDILASDAKTVVTAPPTSYSEIVSLVFTSDL